MNLPNRVIQCPDCPWKAVESVSTVTPGRIDQEYAAHREMMHHSTPTALDITEGPLAGERVIIFPADPEDEPEPSPHPPTREQIAEWRRKLLDRSYDFDADRRADLAKLLALIQNGADR